MTVEKPELQKYQFTCVVFSVGPIPYLLNATVVQHLQQFWETHSNTVKIRESFMWMMLQWEQMICTKPLRYRESKEIFVMY